MQLTVRTGDVALLCHDVPGCDAFLFSPGAAPAPGLKLDVSALELGVQLRLEGRALQLVQPCGLHAEARLLRGTLAATVDLPAVAVQALPAAWHGEPCRKQTLHGLSTPEAVRRLTPAATSVLG